MAVAGAAAAVSDAADGSAAGAGAVELAAVSTDGDALPDIGAAVEAGVDSAGAAADGAVSDAASGSAAGAGVEAVDVELSTVSTDGDSLAGAASSVEPGVDSVVTAAADSFAATCPEASGPAVAG